MYALVTNSPVEVNILLMPEMQLQQSVVSINL